MKLGIIGGAGLLGATTAFQVAAGGIIDEVILYDIKENLAKSHAMDIEQAVCEFSGTKLRYGAFDELAGCDFLLNTAGVPERAVSSRDEFLAGNIEILRGLAQSIRSWGTQPVIISATNPVDVLNYKLFELTGLPAERFVGFCRNDTLRFKWAAAAETGIHTSELNALVIGEHGDGQVPLFSTLKNINSGEELDLTEAQKVSILSRVKTWFGAYQSLDSGRSSGWTSGVGLYRLIIMMLQDSDFAEIGCDEVCSCSVIPDGQYGLSGLSIGLPVKLGRRGVREIVEVDLSADENDALIKAAEKIKGAIKSC